MISNPLEKLFRTYVTTTSGHISNFDSGAIKKPPHPVFDGVWGGSIGKHHYPPFLPTPLDTFIEVRDFQTHCRGQRFLVGPDGLGVIPFQFIHITNILK